MNRIRVLLVDDQNLVRQGIRGLLALSPDIEVVGEASDGLEAIAELERLRPDVMLLDLRMPRMDGIEVLKRLAAEGRRIPTVILTTFDDEELVLAGIEAGARGYLLKDTTLEELVAAIRSVAAGGTLLKPLKTEGLKERLPDERRFGGLDRPDALTEREAQILRLMAGGYSNKEIARVLEVAEGTVKNHVSNILSKLGVRDRTRAVLRALELGWI
ncbi:MAG: DNA-binding response regulator [Lysobacterales bacterium]|jgi:DNA-binding NarL/FixJ family response regulator|nr:MAG: DNA-binding response regulator [Xanthomonadales bacterium]